MHELQDAKDSVLPCRKFDRQLKNSWETETCRTRSAWYPTRRAEPSSKGCPLRPVIIELCYRWLIAFAVLPSLHELS